MGIAAFIYILLSLWVQDSTAILGFTRSDFPQDFVFGAGTSAYQVITRVLLMRMVGAQVFGTLSRTLAKCQTKSTGDIAADGYQKYKEDVKLMSETGLEAYRFSISWSRLIPNGRGAVNPKGLEYYNNLIDELVKHGIQMHVTLHHLDFPQILEEEYGGWLSPRIIEDFTAYADVCFREFGDRITYWTTLNEPNIGAIGSYDSGQTPPGRCSDPFGITKCIIGNSSVEPYIALHTSLLAHASVVRLYREKFQPVQKGVVGINIYSWSYPFTDSTMDLEVTQRCKDFIFGWVLEPLVFGDYPDVMKKIVGSRLPSFTEVQSELVKGSFDFVGINHYYSVYVNARPLTTGIRDFNGDTSIYYRVSRTDPPAGQGAVTNVPSDPKGLQLVLEYLKEAYGNIPIYVHENGKHRIRFNKKQASFEEPDYFCNLILSSFTSHQVWDLVKTASMTLKGSITLSSYMESTLNAVRNGVNVRGYFVWSLVNLFELLAGYQSKYGLYYVNFDDEKRPRQARLSAHWYSDFLKKNGSSIRMSLMDEDMTLNKVS